MQPLAIVLLGVGAAIGYGLVHDQITAHLCVEYFTIGHPPVFGTDDPMLLGLGWGVLATWWVGVLLGVPLAFAARFGPYPKRTARSLVRPLGMLLLIMAACAAAAGVAGYVAVGEHWFTLPQPWSALVPPGRQRAFAVDLWIHNASYAAGFGGGARLCRNVWKERRAYARQS